MQMNDTPSPEAIVREALERAADETDFYSYDAGRDLRHLASDPEFVAAIIKKAGEGRG